MIKTKIVCTIGPSCSDYDSIISLMKAGMNVARINFSHGSNEQHAQVIQSLKKARQYLQQPLAILLDTKGPEIRLGDLSSPLEIHPGMILQLHKENDSHKDNITITPSHIIDEVQVGETILIDDGYVEAKVINKEPNSIAIEILHGSVISSKKAINVPNSTVTLEDVTEKDIEDIRFGCRHRVDIIAASFVRSVSQLLKMKEILKEEDQADTLLFAKIENRQGVEHFDSILQVADGIMIARGDLGVEIPLEEVPKLQKMMIRKSYLAGKCCITATQMLESMIKNPRPTRAEVSDIANAIYDSTSAVMLSGETAIGKFPIKSVEIINSIILATERDFNYRAFFDQHNYLIFHDVPSSVTLAAVKIAFATEAKAIFCLTHSGKTARLISRLRPEIPIIALTPSSKTYHELAINWGVIPLLWHACASVQEAFNKLSSFALEKGLVSSGDSVVITAGSPFGVSGTTNMVLAQSIGDVLIRGKSGYGSRVYGNALPLHDPEQPNKHIAKDRILIICRCDASYLPWIKESAGFIVENSTADSESEQYALKISQELNKPCLTRADLAFHVVREGQLLTIDPSKLLVYRGVVI